MRISISRQNPRTGRIERPWRNRNGEFVLGDPAHGAQKHHDKFAVKVKTLDAVADLVRRGFSLRMTDGETPPSLISPESLTIEEEDSNAPAHALWAETHAKPPFEKAAMFNELKRIMLVQANQIAHAGKHEYAVAFMGFEPDLSLYPFCEDDPEKVDLSRFAATYYLDRAYDYAFQVGKYWGFDENGEARDIERFVAGASPASSDGYDSPIKNRDGLCRRAADTAFGRWKLEDGHGLSIRELALLASMTEPAVRNALSKDRIAIQNGEIDWKDAQAWLQERRDFIPTRTEEGAKQSWVEQSRSMFDNDAFETVFASRLRGLQMKPDQLAAKADVGKSIIDALLAGRPPADIVALQRIGAALELDVPHFVGVAIQASLKAGSC